MTEQEAAGNEAVNVFKDLENLTSIEIAKRMFGGGHDA